MKRFSVSLTVREMEIEITVRYHFPSIRMATILIFVLSKEMFSVFINLLQM